MLQEEKTILFRYCCFGIASCWNFRYPRTSCTWITKIPTRSNCGTAVERKWGRVRHIHGRMKWIRNAVDRCVLCRMSGRLSELQMGRHQNCLWLRQMLWQDSPECRRAKPWMQTYVNFCVVVAPQREEPMHQWSKLAPLQCITNLSRYRLL